MNVQQMQELLSKLPKDAELVFSVWGLKKDSYTHFQVRNPSVITAYKIESGGEAFMIGCADNCRAHTMIEKDNKVLSY